MSSNGLAPEAMDQSLKQPRMFAFFGDEELQRLMIDNVIGRLSARLCNKKFSFASFAKLKMRERMRQDTLRPGIKWARHVPLWFRPVELVVLIIMQPLQ